jgi:glycosyltransferase involved in cell wall biosynthesis
MTRKLSIVIGTFNQKDVLEKVMISFENQSAPSEDYELIIVDSGSTDGTDTLLKAFKATCGYKFFIQENKGKSGARNRGVSEAESPTVMITDADMIAHPDLVKTHIDAHQASKELSCFEGVTLNMHKLEWPTTEKNLFPYITKRYKDGAKLGWYYFLTGNVSFPKVLFEQENGFDQAFQVYGWEDLDLGYRFSKKKIPLYYLKNAQNYHYHVITRDEEIERNVKKGESAKIFLERNPELKLFLGLNPVSIWVYRRLNIDGGIYRFIQNKCYRSSNKILQNFGFWFLKEYNYLSGILSKGKGV